MRTFNSRIFLYWKIIKGTRVPLFLLKETERLLFFYELFYVVLDLAFLKKYIQFFSLTHTSVENVLITHLQKLESWQYG